MQEAALAPRNECHYGDMYLDLIYITRVAAWISYHRNTLPFDLSNETGLENAARIWEFQDMEQGPYSAKSKYHGRLSGILQTLQNFQASEPRDHIFALTGLYMKVVHNTIDRAKTSTLLEPDYSRSLSEVLRDATIHTLIEDETFRCFQFLDLRLDKSRDLDSVPSWVPRWDQPRLGRPQPLWSGFQCCGERNQHLVRDVIRSQTWKDKNVLLVHGIHIDRVDRVWQDVISASNNAEYPRYARQLREIVKGLPDRSDESATRALASTLCESTDHQRPPIDSAVAEDHFEAWMAYVEKKKERPPSLAVLDAKWRSTSDGTLKAAQYNHAFTRVSGNRCVFLTARGRVGIGPRSTSPGDPLLILWGCAWPVIIHPGEGAVPAQLVGTAYVHGIMHGEVVSGAVEACSAATGRSEQKILLQ